MLTGDRGIYVLNVIAVHGLKEPFLGKGLEENHSTPLLRALSQGSRAAQPGHGFPVVILPLLQWSVKIASPFSRIYTELTSPVNMSYNCCSRNFSSCSLGGYLRYPGSSCGSSYPSSLVYSPDLCSPSTCQLGSSVYRGCQTTLCEPARCQTSRVLSSPCQVSCYRPRTSTLCSPSLSTYSGSLGCGSSRGYSLGCGSLGFRPLACGIQSCHPHSTELTFINMSYNCCSRNFSSCSLGGYLRYPGSSCGSSYPSSLVYSPDLCSPSTCQLGPSVYRGCQTTRREPARCQTSRVVSSPCQVSCYRPRTSTLCSPSLSTYSGSLGCGSSSFSSQGCGPSGFRPLGYAVCGSPSLSYGSRLCRPTYFAPSSLVYSPDLCSPSTCQLGSSVYSGCQEACCEPARCQTSCVVSRSCQTFTYRSCQENCGEPVRCQTSRVEPSPCQVPCYRPRTSTLCSPSLSTYPGSLGCGSSNFSSQSCGPSGFRPLAELTLPVNMSYNCCSRNFSSCSLGGYLRYPGSSYPSNLVYSTDLCSPRNCQLGSSVYSGCQETC
ncbi:hypothetical protein MC885_013375, partial [Smutsia gigantea]